MLCLVVLVRLNCVSRVFVILWGFLRCCSLVMSLRFLCLVRILLMVVNCLVRLIDVWICVGWVLMLYLVMVMVFLLDLSSVDRMCIVVVLFVLFESSRV